MANKKTNRNDPKLREDIASFKAMMAFIIFFILIFIIATNIENNKATYAFRNYLDHHAWLLVIPFGIFAVSAVLRIMAGIKKTDESYRYFSTHDFLGLSSLFVVFSLTFAATTNILMYSIIIVGFAVGYYSKRFFGADFYIVTLLNLAMAFGLWLKFGNKGWSTTLSEAAAILLFAGVAVTVILIVAFTVARLVYKDKSAGILDKALLVFGVDKSVTDFSKLCLIPVFISLVIGAAVALVMLTVPQYLTLLVAEIILLVQYAALGVFYTVKLINQ